MQKRVIIFGSSGFIGSALARWLKLENLAVYGCDITHSDWCEKDNFYPAEMLEQAPEIIFKHPFDICINCAGSASVPASFVNPFNDYELNTRIVFKILSELKKVDSQARFINLSSAAVYGNPQRLPVSETDALHPISPYGNHKLMSEMIVNQFRDYFGMQTVSLRIFSAYGPGLRKQIFWDMYQKALQSDELIMFGTGDESRDFIYIDDLCEAVTRIALAPQLAHAVYNIANGEEVRISEIAHLFCKNLSSSLKHSFNGEVRSGDPVNWRADITRLSALGYKKQITMADGIQRLVQWLKQQK